MAHPFLFDWTVHPFILGLQDHRLGMPIDYSKWDKLDEYSDSETEDEVRTRPSPRVTRLDAPSRVTFGGRDHEEEDGAVQISTQSPVASTAVSPWNVTPTTRAEEIRSPAKGAGTTLPGGTTPQPSPSWKASSWTNHGGSEVTKDQRHLFWSQDRYSVQIRLELRSEEKVRSVQVNGILPYSDRHCATGSQKEPRLIITGSLGRDKESNDFCVLDGGLPHAVYLTENDDDDDEIDWNVEVDEEKSRFLVANLYKAVPMQGVFVWWKRPLLEFEEIELKERSAASEAFLQAWDEAHRQFREKHGK